MKKIGKKVIFIITGIIILSIFLYNNVKSRDKVLKDESLLFKTIKLQEKYKDMYILSLSNKYIDFKNINLYNTIDKTTLSNEKIAPRDIRNI